MKDKEIDEFVCEECLDILLRSGRFLFEEYVRICEAFIKNEAYSCSCNIYGNAPSIIHYLEMKGFVITTEYYDDKILAVKPLGISLNGNEDSLTICAHRASHR